MWEILLILLVVLLLFGAKRLPEVGSSIGKGIREFKRSISDTQDAIMNTDEQRPTSRLVSPTAPSSPVLPRASRSGCPSNGKAGRQREGGMNSGTSCPRAVPPSTFASPTAPGCAWGALVCRTLSRLSTILAALAERVR